MQKLLILLLLFSYSYSFSQYTTKKRSAIVKYEEGRKAYAMMKYDNSIVFLNEALEKDENFIEPNLLLAELYDEIRQYDKSLQYFIRVLEINPRYNPLLYMRLAEMELRTAKYADAVIHLVRYKEITGIPKPFVDKWNYLKINADFGSEALKNPVPFEPINMGNNINTKLDEYHPSITVDGKTLVYTGKDYIGKAPNGKPIFKEDLYYSRKSTDDDWAKSINFRGPINTRNYNEGASSISHDGKYLFFTACNREDGLGSCDLYISLKEGGSWVKPQNMGSKINSGAWESHPSLSPDGETLYFASNRPGGKGKTDIWKSIKDENGIWQKPVNMEINTPGSDQTPHIHADGRTFYFSSNGRPGMGAHDIYVSRLNEKGEYSNPKNLGYPINSEKEEFGMIADPEGRLAYYASEMDGGMGGLDLYQFELPEDMRPVFTTFITGHVYDGATKEKLSAHVELIDLLSGEIIAATTSDKINGEFLAALPSNSDYALNVSKQRYLFYSDNISISGREAVEKKFEIYLSKIKEGEAVVLKNVFFDLGKHDLKSQSKAELTKLKQMLNDNPNLKIEVGGHTDKTGNEGNNVQLSKRRAQSVVDYLVSIGIDVSRLSAKGFGSSKPIAENETEEGRAQNRRTEFRVI